MATYRAPGRYYLSEANCAEGEELLRAAQAALPLEPVRGLAAASSSGRSASGGVAAASARGGGGGGGVAGAGPSGKSARGGGVSGVAAAGCGGGLSPPFGLSVLTPPLQVPAAGIHTMTGGDIADLRSGGSTPDFPVHDAFVAAQHNFALDTAAAAAVAAVVAAAGAAAKAGGGTAEREVGAGATAGAGTGARAGAGTTGAAGAAGVTGTAAASLAFTAPVSPRVAGDVDDSWMAYREQAAADDAGGGGAGGGGTLCPELRCDADFHRWRSEYHARYGTYIAMHGALEANALEFRELTGARDAAAARGGNGGGYGGEGGAEGVSGGAGGPEAAALSRRMAEFRVVRHVRYGGMAAVFEWMERELSAIKRRVNDYAARP